MTPPENLILSIIITFFIFIKLEYKTSFLDIYSRLLNSNPKQQRRILDKLMFYLTFSNEELATFNVGKYKRIPYQLLYHIFRFAFILLTIYIIFDFAIKFKIVGGGFLLLLFLLSPFVISFPTIILWLNTKDFKLNFERIKALRNAILGNFIISYLTIIFIVFTYVLFSNINEIDIIGLFTFPNSDSPIRFESINGKILSLASIYFTLAIGGTIVLSFLRRHHEQIDILEAKIFELKRIYINWIEENRLDDKIFNFKNAETFNSSLNNLRDKVELGEINKIKEPIRNYEIFIYFIFIYYFMGVLALISNGFLIEWIYLIGWASLIPYIMILFTIFNYYE